MPATSALKTARCEHGDAWRILLCAKCRTRLEWTPTGMVTCPRGHTRLYRLSERRAGNLMYDADGLPIYPRPGIEFDGPLADIRVEHGRADIVVWCRMCRAVIEGD